MFIWFNNKFIRFTLADGSGTGDSTQRPVAPTSKAPDSVVRPCPINMAHRSYALQTSIRKHYKDQLPAHLKAISAPTYLMETTQLQWPLVPRLAMPQQPVIPSMYSAFSRPLTTGSNNAGAKSNSSFLHKSNIVLAVEVIQRLARIVPKHPDIPAQTSAVDLVDEKRQFLLSQEASLLQDISAQYSSNTHCAFLDSLKSSYFTQKSHLKNLADGQDFKAWYQLIKQTSDVFLLYQKPNIRQDRSSGPVTANVSSSTRNGTNEPSLPLPVNNQSLQMLMDKISDSGSRYFSRETRDILEDWYKINRESPYASDDEASELARQTGISAAQVQKWLSNKRNRDGNTKRKRRNTAPEN